MGRGKNKEEELHPFLSSHALTIPYFYFIFSGIPSGSLCGVGGQEVKRHFFFFKDIAGKMVRHESTNIKRQENWTFQFSQTNKYIIYVVSAVNLNQPVIEANGDNVIYVLHEHQNNLLKAE